MKRRFFSIQHHKVVTIYLNGVVFFCQNDAPSKTAVRPYKRLTAQEVCYQRMQMAQQQAAQLSAAAKAARSSQSSSPSFSGEKKRIAHRPNPQITSSKTSMLPLICNLARFIFYFLLLVFNRISQIIFFTCDSRYFGLEPSSVERPSYFV